ncbi:MFS transporter, DHA1 family, multidrug resistance protein [Pleurostoma richardsiae]|uniref:MFS transporter, DHA1 family, multidrug resistance protein n=1 Tax=Pleurostoma richardsiae TaxID=41990 RepID=A0AA38RN79_9PEZI|nr:MFS transporter, DHA1 family, multidrug resistance protein [Pleurostoma richardsiae]
MTAAPDDQSAAPGQSSRRVSHWDVVKSHSLITDEILSHVYEGSGTAVDPFLVNFPPNDPRNPMNFSTPKKWFITSVVTASVFAVTLTSSAYSGSSKEITRDFGISSELAAAGISLFVLGFAVGPCLWAPLSELYGRQVLFVSTNALVVAFVAGAAGSRNVASLLVFRFLGGTFGASPLTNAGGVIADIFPPSHRGLGMALFSAAPFLGPLLGPIVAGFISMNVGWRWVQGTMAILIGVIWIAGSLTIPETYAPVLLRRRAKRLSKQTGKCYISLLERDRRDADISALLARVLKRPWQLLFREPIVLVASVYMAILYGTLYMLFGAFPIVYQQQRGWSEGVGGLAFLGTTVGMVLGLSYVIVDNKRYRRLHDGPYKDTSPPPEARLPPAIVGAIALPVGMFWFAWTCTPEYHWAIGVAAGAPFGFGMVLVFLSCINYLVDAYTVYAASVLAAGAMLRAYFGAAFPLFTRVMYERLGVHWASSIPGFLTLACLPFPLLVYRHGESLRMRCKYAKEAALVMAQLESSSDDQ